MAYKNSHSVMLGDLSQYMNRCCKEAYEQGRADERAKVVEEVKDLIILLYQDCKDKTELCARFRDKAEQLKEQSNE